MRILTWLWLLGAWKILAWLWLLGGVVVFIYFIGWFAVALLGGILSIVLTVLALITLIER